jgi:hypothetical protein
MGKNDSDPLRFHRRELLIGARRLAEGADQRRVVHEISMRRIARREFRVVG